MKFPTAAADTHYCVNIFIFEPAKLFPEHNAFQNFGMYKIIVTWPTGWIRELQNSSFWQYPHTGIDLLLVELCFTLPVANIRAGADFLRDSQLWGLILPFFSLWELTLSDVVSNNMLVLEPYEVSNIWFKKKLHQQNSQGKKRPDRDKWDLVT